MLGHIVPPGLQTAPPAVGTNAAIEKQEGFGTLSRQLGIDGGYRSFQAAVSGRYTRVTA
jgi:hypothetical protein